MRPQSNLHDAFPRCAAAATVAEACEGLVDDLRELYPLPSVYLLVDGRLRCQAARGYYQVIDGFTPGIGVIGRVVATGVPQILQDVSQTPDFIAAIPGLVAEACVPVRIGAQVIGAISVESYSVLPASIQEVLEAAADVLAERIQAGGGLPAAGPAARLARVAVRLSALTDPEQIYTHVLQGAIDISGMNSASLCLRDPDAHWSLAHAAGPLAADLSSWTKDQYRIVARCVRRGTSSHFRGGSDDIPAKSEFLLRAGVQAVMVHPLIIGRNLVGMLVTAHTQPIRHNPVVGALVELLAVQTATSLGMAAAIDQLNQRARQDHLTGLGNTATFAEDLDEAAHDTGEQDRPVCLIIDIDHFKAINDTFGHPAGDQLLRDLATELSSALRSTDALYRIGGDEFAALLQHTSPALVDDVAQRLVIAARRVRTTVSIGAATFGQNETAEHLRGRADRALYRAKAAGRDQTVIARTDAAER